MNTFKKEERLSSRKAISHVVKEGNSFLIHPFKVYWVKFPLESSYPTQIAFSIPKKNFKKAVDRNKIRRRIKESYRLNKHSFYNFLSEREAQLELLFVYIAKETLSYKEIEEKIILTLRRLEVDYEKRSK
jgi:ribonuclease P protein component